ncbi:uncharacterized protein [Apostichopus japonicus]|uniref:uncharacterized protein n=1 Tax=Stichopus japonicus TaxID=307972 RepID=UPI003AB1BCFA
MDLGQYEQNWNSLKEGLMRCAEQDEHVITDDTDLLIYLAAKVAVGKRIKKLHAAISVADVTFIPKSSAKEAPRLVLIRHESSEYRNGFLLFNSLTIELHKDNLMELVLLLIQCYYAWDLTCPIQYQILGFLQLYLLKDSDSDFKKSANFLRFQKKI